MALEIERKFLVVRPSIPTKGTWPVLFADSHITQTYLVPLKDTTTSERVRVRTPADGGPCVYTQTCKVRVADGVHEEDEREISHKSHERLLKRADPSMVPVHKIRRVFDWAGRTFELDMFKHPFGGLVLLEVELPSMEDVVELPPFIQIEREVTTEKEYTNAALARRGRWP